MIEYVRAFLRRSYLIKNTAYMFSAQMGSTVLGFFGTVIIIRELGPSDFGLYATAVVFINLLTGITDFGLTTSAIKFGSYYLKKEPHKADILFRAMGRLKVIISLAVTVAGFLLAETLAVRIYHKPDLVFPLQVSMICIAMNIMLAYVQSIIEARQEFLKSSLLSFIVALAKLAAILAICYIFHSVTLKSMLYLLIGLGFFSVGFSSLLINKDFLFQKPDKEQARQIQREAWHFSKWVMISTLCFPLAKRLDIVMLNYYADSTMVGIYACAFQLALPLRTLKGALHSVLLPKISKINTFKGYADYTKKSTLLILGLCLCFVPVMILAGPIIHAILSARYAQSVFIFQLLIVKMIFILLFNPLHLIAYSAGHPWIISIKDVLALLINIVANIILIPMYGIEGAAYGTILTTIIGGIIPIVYIYYKIIAPMAASEKKMEKLPSPEKSHYCN